MTTALLESGKAENDRRKYFVIIFHATVWDWAGIKLTTPGAAIGSATDCNIGPGLLHILKCTLDSICYHGRNTILFGNNNLWPLCLYNGSSQVYRIKQEEIIIHYYIKPLRVKRSSKIKYCFTKYYSEYWK